MNKNRNNPTNIYSQQDPLLGSLYYSGSDVPYVAPPTESIIKTLDDQTNRYLTTRQIKNAQKDAIDQLGSQYKRNEENDAIYKRIREEYDRTLGSLNPEDYHTSVLDVDTFVRDLDKLGISALKQDADVVKEANAKMDKYFADGHIKDPGMLSWYKQQQLKGRKGVTFDEYGNPLVSPANTVTPAKHVELVDMSDKYLKDAKDSGKYKQQLDANGNPTGKYIVMDERGWLGMKKDTVLEPNDLLQMSIQYLSNNSEVQSYLRDRVRYEYDMSGKGTSAYLNNVSQSTLKALLGKPLNSPDVTEEDIQKGINSGELNPDSDIPNAIITNLLYNASIPNANKYGFVDEDIVWKQDYENVLAIKNAAKNANIPEDTAGTVVSMNMHNTETNYAEVIKTIDTDLTKAIEESDIIKNDYTSYVNTHGDKETDPIYQQKKQAKIRQEQKIANLKQRKVEVGRQAQAGIQTILGKDVNILEDFTPEITKGLISHNTKLFRNVGDVTIDLNNIGLKKIEGQEIKLTGKGTGIYRYENDRLSKGNYTYQYTTKGKDTYQYTINGETKTLNLPEGFNIVENNGTFILKTNGSNISSSNFKGSDLESLIFDNNGNVSNRVKLDSNIPNKDIFYRAPSEEEIYQKAMHNVANDDVGSWVWSSNYIPTLEKYKGKTGTGVIDKDGNANINIDTKDDVNKVFYGGADQFATKVLLDKYGSLEEINNTFRQNDVKVNRVTGYTPKSPINQLNNAVRTYFAGTLTSAPNTFSVGDFTLENYFSKELKIDGGFGKVVDTSKLNSNNQEFQADLTTSVDEKGKPIFMVTLPINPSLHKDERAKLEKKGTVRGNTFQMFVTSDMSPNQKTTMLEQLVQAENEYRANNVSNITNNDVLDNYGRMIFNLSPNKEEFDAKGLNTTAYNTVTKFKMHYNDGYQQDFYIKTVDPTGNFSYNTANAKYTLDRDVVSIVNGKAITKQETAVKDSTGKLDWVDSSIVNNENQKDYTPYLFNTTSDIEAVFGKGYGASVENRKAQQKAQSNLAGSNSYTQWSNPNHIGVIGFPELEKQSIGIMFNNTPKDYNIKNVKGSDISGKHYLNPETDLVALDSFIPTKNLKTEDNDNAFLYVNNSIKDRLSEFISIAPDAIITEAYRDINRNKELGGASNSIHQMGYAIDVSFNDQNSRNAMEALMKNHALINKLGIVILKHGSGDNIHYDVKFLPNSKDGYVGINNIENPLFDVDFDSAWV